MNIKKDSLDMFSSAKSYNLVVFVNDKEVELSISLNYNSNSDTEDIDWEYLTQVDLTDEESDELSEYVDSCVWLSNKQRIIKINKFDFLEWFYNDKQDLQSLGNSVKCDIQEEGVFSLTLEDVFNSVGYIPVRFIKNADEFKDLVVDDEIGESDLQDLKVEWV